jgi:hypothetical protein
MLYVCFDERKNMNEYIMRPTPLITSWPIPLSIENLKECFGWRKNTLSNKDKNKKLFPFARIYEITLTAY